PSSGRCTWWTPGSRRPEYPHGKSIRGKEGAMRRVRHLLEAKAPEVFAIGPDAPVVDAIRLMAEKGIGAVVVIQAGQLVGILSERDYARKIVLQGRSSGETPVRDIMSSQVTTVHLDDSVEHCM